MLLADEVKYCVEACEAKREMLLADEVKYCVEACEGWSSWDMSCAPSTRDLKSVSACLHRLLHTLRSGGESLEYFSSVSGAHA